MQRGCRVCVGALCPCFDTRPELTRLSSFAGIHPAAATMDLLFWNLLHNPDTLRRVSVEIKDKFLSLTTDSKALSLSDVECRLPYLRACVKENFRITPAFSMPLARYVTENETVLNGEEIPRGVSFGQPILTLLHRLIISCRLPSHSATMHSTITPKSGDLTTTCTTPIDGNRSRAKRQASS